MTLPPQSNSTPSPGMPPAATISQIISTGAAPAPASNSLVASLKARLRSKAVMAIIAIAGVGAIGAKFFEPALERLDFAALLDQIGA